MPKTKKKHLRSKKRQATKMTDQGLIELMKQEFLF